MHTPFLTVGNHFPKHEYIIGGQNGIVNNFIEIFLTFLGTRSGRRADYNTAPLACQELF